MTRVSTVVLPTPRDARTDDDARLRALSEAPVITVFQRLASWPKGLTEPEAADRLRDCGDNLVEPVRGPVSAGAQARRSRARLLRCWPVSVWCSSSWVICGARSPSRS